MGAQKGAFRSAVFVFLLFFIVLHDDLSPAFAPKAYKWTSTEVFFMPKIQKLPTFLG
ncbi:hypothetical protein DD53_04140 [Salmonella enterica subsp. enterica serovar Litchfield]|nr:hypothetical protein AEU79_13590 [Salmonella enterica subsp. enterica serovar Litchfield]KTO22700.1 hypothetical protein IN65_03780 [Salmonella enterica]KNO40947.1 hypothetical protein AEV42_06245 [Salmonella enterica subsp. enterica serovar Litchfield]KNO65367.1 hypothetical protein AEV50_22000 [Salmonella enterica subsp. enterica serovar Litchfield]KNO67718.1 hypothetical protein AEV49_04820 [Salmonella enterica subsp. enterica serovar Litchfield]